MKDIKKLRQRASITQAQLAKALNVSQSFIAKIEQGLIEPKYSLMQELLAYLRNKNAPVIVAKDIMHPTLISCKSTDSLATVLKNMQKYAVSQMPVFCGDLVVGTISEVSILHELVKSNHVLTVSSVMTDAPPVLSEHTTLLSLKSLLIDYDFVLIQREGKVVGVISRIDLVKNLLE